MSDSYYKTVFSFFVMLDKITDVGMHKEGARLEIISSEKMIREQVRSSGVLEYFSFEPSFQLNHYHPGELLTSPFERNRYLQFIVEGEVLLYDMPSEDSVAAIDSPFARVEVIGETELIDPNFPTFFVEAKSDVYALALPLAEYRESLLNDNQFLRFISASLTKKLSHATSPIQKLPAKEQLKSQTVHCAWQKRRHKVQPRQRFI